MGAPFFSRSAAKSRKFFFGMPKIYFDIFGLEYSYWFAQLNKSRISLLFKFKRENFSRIRRSNGVVQIAILSKSTQSQTTVGIALCGTTFFYSRQEIENLVEKFGKLIIIFNPDKKYDPKIIENWNIDSAVNIRTICTCVSFYNRLFDQFKNLVLINSISSAYDLRLAEFENIYKQLECELHEGNVDVLYTKDIISPFDMFFLYKLNVNKKIWKNIVPGSLEQEYFKLFNKNDFPLDEIHFYSEYQKKSILNYGYIKNKKIINRILIEPEPYFMEIFSSINLTDKLVNKLENLLIIGVWAHGDRGALRKNIEFLKFLILISISRKLKNKFYIVYKPHPNKRHSAFLLAYLKIAGIKIESLNTKIIDLIKIADTVISWGSLSTVYAIGLQKKVVYPKNKYINFWTAYEQDDFEKNELVEVANNFQSVIAASLKKLPLAVLIRRKKRLYKIFGMVKVFSDEA